MADAQAIERDSALTGAASNAIEIPIHLVIGMVVPAESIAELLDREEVLKDRQEQKELYIAAEHRLSVIPLGGAGESSIAPTGVKVILASMTSKVGPKGQVVIPKNMRDLLGISPGDDVDFALDGAAVRVSLVREATSLRGSLAGRGLVSALEADHRTERER